MHSLEGLDFWEITAAKIASSMQLLPGSTAGTIMRQSRKLLVDFRVGCTELPDGCTS